MMVFYYPLISFQKQRDKSSISGSAIFTIAQINDGLSTSLKINLMFGIAKELSISQGD